MSTELSNGVIIPEEYSDDWYDEMSINLRKLNDVITAASDNATDIQRLDTDKANQSDLTSLTSRVTQNESDIIALQTAVSGALKREIVQTLPTEDISTTTIYMIRNSESSGTNIYDEYMYINSQWELIGTSATDFSNYYTKNETDNLLSGKVDNSTLGSYYTKTESDNLLSAKANQTDLTSLSGRVTQNETDITALQTAVSGALKREIVQSLPTQDISTTTIYMIRNTTTSGDNIYDEYMYINNLWELIGTSATDFSNYYTKTEIDTLLSGKANNSDVVHNTGDETISGEKNFQGLVKTAPASSLWPIKSRTTDDITFLHSSAVHVEQRGSGNLSDLSNGAWNIANLGVGCFFFRNNQGTDIRYKHLALNTVNRIYVVSNANRQLNNVTPETDNTYDLGSSSLRWKTFNGLNPSSLSFPDLDNGIDISSYITNFGAGTVNEYTPIANGWISIANSGDSPVFIRVYNDYGFEQVAYSERNEVGGTTDGTYTRYGSIMIPCIKNIKIHIIVSPSTSVLVSAKFYPCQGNV